MPLRLLGIGLPLAIVLGTILAVLLFPDLNLWEAAVLSTILAPTDAALGQAIVNSSQIPASIRQAINIESGLNDGICLPILLLFISLAEETTKVWCCLLVQVCQSTGNIWRNNRYRCRLSRY